MMCQGSIVLMINKKHNKNQNFLHFEQRSLNSVIMIDRSFFDTITNCLQYGICCYDVGCGIESV